MFNAVTLTCLFVFSTTSATTTGNHTSTGFCYNDEAGCGPSTTEWAPLCHNGQRQSPINLPLFALPLGSTPLRYSVYRGDYFRMQNNGHSVVIDFDNQAPSNDILNFPDPSKIYGINPNGHGQRQYKFANAHFHWGSANSSGGSEHCIGGRCSAMELHLVHHLANYSSVAAAVASGDENALSVIGVLIDPGFLQTIGGGILNLFSGRNPTTGGTGALKPIVDNLQNISTADHDPSKFTTVNASLDLTKLLYEAGAQVYTYKGSLTTPGCNEQVNWFVLKRPAATGNQNVEAFRSMLRDSRGAPMTENRRPTQNGRGRRVLLSNVFPS